ncbi:MAG: O-antigen ligase family protein [bacterium]|nr:O-antigen ligase family protein [bacterium]
MRTGPDDGIVPPAMETAAFRSIRRGILLALLVLVPLLYVEPALFGIELTDSFNFPKRQLVQAAALALAALFLLELSLAGGVTVRLGRWTMPLSLLIAWSAASLAWAPSPGLGLAETARWACCGLIILSAAGDLRGGSPVLVLAGAAGAAVSSLSLLQFFGLDPSGFSGGLHRVYATVGNPNFIASYLAVVLPVGYWGWLSPDSGRRAAAACLLLSLAGTAAILATASRGGAAAFALGMAAAAIILRPRVVRRRLIALSASAAFLAVLFVLPSPLNRYDTLPMRKLSELAGGGGGGTAWRLMVWRVGLGMWAERPLIGAGAGSFPVLYLPHAAGFLSSPAGAPYAALAEGGIDHAHNEYLELCVENGVIGCGLFIWFLLALIGGAAADLRRGRDGGADWRGAALFGGCIAAAADGAVGFPFRLWPAAATFFVFAGLLVRPSSAAVAVRAGRGVLRIAAGAAAAAILLSGALLIASDIRSEAETARGLAAFRGGRFAEAEGLFGRAVARRPANGMARFFRGVCLSRLGRSGEAAVELRAALAVYGRQAVYVELGRALAATGRDEEAERLVVLAARMLPRDPSAWLERGGILFRRGDPAGAAASYARAAELDPRSAPAARNLAVSLHAAGEEAAALAAYERAASLNPADADIHVNMGTLRARAGEMRRAKAAWTRALEIDPENRSARVNLERAAGDPG